MSNMLRCAASVLLLVSNVVDLRVGVIESIFSRKYHCVHSLHLYRSVSYGVFEVHLEELLPFYIKVTSPVIDAL